MSGQPKYFVPDSLPTFDGLWPHEVVALLATAEEVELAAKDYCVQLEGRVYDLIRERPERGRDIAQLLKEHPLEPLQWVGEELETIVREEKQRRKPDIPIIRAWARARGIEVSAYGRLRDELITRYRADTSREGR